MLAQAQHLFARTEPKAWEVIVQLEGRLNDKTIPRHIVGREKRVVALEQYLSQTRTYDVVLDGLRSAVRYDPTYFDKIVASLLPLLEKLTTGKIAQLLAPNYSDLSDPRPIFDWMQIIRKRAVVYVGLNALSDAEVAAAVGNSIATWSPSPATSTSSASTTGYPAQRWAPRFRSTSTPTNSMNSWATSSSPWSTRAAVPACR